MRLAIALGAVLACRASAAYAAGTASQYQVVDLTASNYPDAVAFSAALGQQVGQGGNHALLWTGSAGSVVDLHPSGGAYSNTQASATDGTTQVGSGGISATSRHALMWTGTAASVVNLNPSGIVYSEALGVVGNQQVGYGRSSGGNDHALLWQGTAASRVDLHPAGYSHSYAAKTNGATQVGTAFDLQSGFAHPVVWTGSAASAVDLLPTGFRSGQAEGISGGEVVGYGGTASGDVRGIAWHGDRNTYVDLTPAGYNYAVVENTNGDVQVGYASSNANTLPLHATAWAGSAASAVDLHGFLPATYTTSLAWGVDEQGRITGLARVGNGPNHAIMWVPVVPEPAVAGGAIALAASPFVRRSRRRR